MRIAFHTLGCKLNQAESEEIKEKLAQAGFLLVSPKTKAHLYIVNGCSVTKIAERKTHQAIWRLKRKGRPVWLTGCVVNPSQSADQLVLKKEKLASLVENRFSLTKFCSSFQASQNIKVPTRTRALIKIQTGCDNFCSFCLVPYLRGRPQSVAPEKIIKKIKEKEEQNFQEIILTGINIMKYLWRDFDLADLVKKILPETKIPRLRFGSIDPALVGDKFLDLFENPRILPHLHLSLQSGSAKILRKMNRKYTPEEYLSLASKIKKRWPNFSFTTDIIVGFPGESEEDFRKTCEFCQKVGFLKIHVFPYSARPGTAASKMSGQIEEEVKKKRAQVLRKVGLALQRQFQVKMLGEKVKVLWEGKRGDFWLGHAENFLKLKLKSPQNLENKISELMVKKENLLSQ